MTGDNSNGGGEEVEHEVEVEVDDWQTDPKLSAIAVKYI